MGGESSAEFPTDDPTWDLEPIFEGGPESEQFDDFLGELDDRLEALAERIDRAPPLGEMEAEQTTVIEEWAELLDEMQQTGADLSEARSFARAHAAADTETPAARELPQRVGELASRMDRLEKTVVQRFEGAGEAVVEALTDSPPLEGLGLYFREFRRRADRSMSETEERLVADLNRDGLHAWGDFYQLATGSVEVELEDPETGEREVLSVGRAKNRLSDPSRPVRRNAHRGLGEAWSERSAEFASMLNNILGTRLTLADRRGADLLDEPLENNRIERSSLSAMMEAVETFQPVVHDYLEAKARALGVEELEFYDLRAPVGSTEEASISWERAQEFVVEQVASFSRPMADFYRRALRSQWVEAEDREGKGQGAFCTPFRRSREVRVFMTFGGTMKGVMTLAHELGHAYHNWTLRDRAPAAQKVPMTLAESASTLSEKAVESAALAATDSGRTLGLLDERLFRAATFLLDTPSRFRLERKMLETRRDGRIRPGELTAMTREVFGEAFGDALGSFDDYLWASKLHFYLTRAPFYNFPYTVGYLVSKAIYDRIAEGDEELRDRLDELLFDSGIRSVESIAEEYLGADLADPDFWRGAMESIRDDIDRYETLVDSED